MQVSRSKKWDSKPILDEDGNPKLTEKGKNDVEVILQCIADDFFNFMRDAGYTDVERGERGSTEEHLTVTQFKVQAETAAVGSCDRTGGSSRTEFWRMPKLPRKKQKKELEALQKETKTAKTLVLHRTGDRGLWVRKNSFTGNIHPNSR